MVLMLVVDSDWAIVQVLMLEDPVLCSLGAGIKSDNASCQRLDLGLLFAEPEVNETLS